MTSVSDVKFPKDAGSFPPRLLKPRYKISSFPNDPISEGTPPPRSLRDKSSSNNLEQLARSTGISPMRKL
ncbi:hypothetical protein HID58_059097 [Brassica napus]|uniref:Uncharacterized protein n=1 Tax=Brassica napus TaxID=3708 RepID=A0ABQ7ZS02_BRANA|nr:hypothetical protein HID58_059097 [Brassica napus]